MGSTPYVTQRWPRAGDARLSDFERRFRVAYEDYFDFVWRLARGLGVAPSDLDDVVHEVFVVVQRRLDGFDAERSMRAWLAGITRNVVLHHRRASARRWRKIAAVPVPPPAPTPGELFERTEALRLMERFLEDLDPGKREVFVLMEIEGLTAREVAGVVGVAHPTLYSRLRAARARFAEFVEAVNDPGGER